MTHEPAQAPKKQRTERDRQDRAAPPRQFAASASWLQFALATPVDQSLEREADRVALRVVSGDAPGPLARAPTGIHRCAACGGSSGGGGKCARCAAAETFALKLMRAPAAASPAGSQRELSMPPVPGDLGPGSALPHAERSFYEGRFGADFGSVRLHTDGFSSGLTESLGALAFTYGEHIAFAPGRLDFASASGKRLVAHELTHVLQQRRGAGGQAPMGIQAAPRGMYFGMAGNCWWPYIPSTRIGEIIHVMIQEMMIAQYPALMQAEVAIPGGGSGMGLPGTGTPGRADLFMSAPLPHVTPAVPQGWAFPAPALPSPPLPAPDVGLIGSIKPATMLIGGLEPVARADLATYLIAHDLYHNLHAPPPPRRRSYTMPLPPPPALLYPGLLFRPDYPPQMLHAFTRGDGLYWYFCRPLVEVLAPGLAWLWNRMKEFLRRLAEKLKELGQQIPVYARMVFEAVVNALAAALEAIGQFLHKYGWYILGVVLAIIAIVLIVIFWEVIVAAALAAAAAVAAALAEIGLGLAALLEGASALAALYLALNPAAAAAEEGPPPLPEGEGLPLQEARTPQREGSLRVTPPRRGANAVVGATGAEARRVAGSRKPDPAALRRLRTLIEQAAEASAEGPGGSMFGGGLSALARLVDDLEREAALGSVARQTTTVVPPREGSLPRLR